MMSAEEVLDQVIEEKKNSSKNNKKCPNCGCEF